jgi:predicted small lipoprotein YifL
LPPLEHPLPLPRPNIPIALAVVVAAALALSGCGRKGGLDPPPADSAVPVTPQALGPPPGQPLSPTAALLPGASSAPSGETPQETAAKTGFDALGNPVAGPGQKKSFFLDPLLQ